MNFYYDTSKLKRWLTTYKPPYVISEKLDGVSGLLTYQLDKSDAIKLYTRGNGQKGKDISHLIPFLKLPKVSRSQGVFVVRGEFIIKKDIFKKKYASLTTKALSLVAGIIGNKTLNKEKLKDLEFIVFEIISPEISVFTAISTISFIISSDKSGASFTSTGGVFTSLFFCGLVSLITFSSSSNFSDV